jgi:hypothetical protein
MLWKVIREIYQQLEARVAVLSRHLKTSEPAVPRRPSRRLQESFFRDQTALADHTFTGYDDEEQHAFTNQ